MSPPCELQHVPACVLRQLRVHSVLVWVLSPCIRSCIRSVPAGRSANPTEWSKTKLRLDCDGWRAIIARAAALSTPEGTPRWKRRPNLRFVAQACESGLIAAGVPEV